MGGCPHHRPLNPPLAANIVTAKTRRRQRTLENGRCDALKTMVAGIKKCKINVISSEYYVMSILSSV